MTQSDTQIADSAPHPRATAAPVQTAAAPVRSTAAPVQTTAAPVRAATAPPTEPRPPDDLVEEDLLVEDVSIDGMCGVY